MIADRHYCPSEFLFAIEGHRAAFVVRQHLGHLRWELLGERRSRGRVENGLLFEQEVDLTDPQTEEVMRVRRISLELDRPTRNGDGELHILTNLPARTADAERVAALYRDRWSIETAFQELTTTLRCELHSLAYPPAALFAFCTAVACFNMLTVIRAALSQAHGTDTIDEEVSKYRLLDEISGTYRGMLIALPPTTWRNFATITHEELAGELVQWARQTSLARYKKQRRGAKTRKKRPYKPTGHVATARLIQKKRPRKNRSD